MILLHLYTLSKKKERKKKEIKSGKAIIDSVLKNEYNQGIYDVIIQKKRIFAHLRLHLSFSIKSSIAFS